MFFFYNKEDNVILMVKTKQSQHTISHTTSNSQDLNKSMYNDLGTIYRPPTKNMGLEWASFVDQIQKAPNGVMLESGKTEDVREVFNSAVKAINNPTKGKPLKVYNEKIDLISKGKDEAAVALKEKEKAVEDVIEQAVKETNEEKKENAEKGKNRDIVPTDSSKLSNAADLIDEAVDKADEGAKALKAGRAAKLGKLGVVTSAGMTVVVAGFIDEAHATKRESAELFLKSGAITQDTLGAYITLNKKVEKMMHAENIASQGWAFIATTPIVEAKAASLFTEFSQTHNLTPIAHKALGLSMFDGKSTIGKFADAAFEAVPNRKEGVPKSLHALIDSKKGVVNANDNLAEIKTVIAPKDLGGSNLKAILSAKESLPEAAKDKVNATVTYSKQFLKTISDPEAAKYLVNKMPNKVLLDMTVALTRSNQIQANVNPLIRNLAESQEKQSSLEVKKEKIDKQLASHKDGKFAMSKFTDAAFKAIPSNKEGVPKSLHALIDSKGALIKASKNLIKTVSDVAPSGDMIGSYLSDIKNAKQGVVEAQLDKANAKVDYSKQFQKTLSDPMAAKYLATKMPKNVQSEMNSSTFTTKAAEVQVRQSSLEAKKINIDRQLDDSKELTRTIEKKLSTQPEVVRNYIIKQMGNHKPAKILETDPKKKPKSSEEKNRTHSKTEKLESNDYVKPYSSLSSVEKKQYLPTQAWKQLGFLPKEGEKGERFTMKNAQGEEKTLRMYSANTVRAADVNDKREPAQVSSKFQQQIAQTRSQNRNQASEIGGIEA